MTGCLRCGMVTAAVYLGVPAIDPAMNLVCVEHFKEYQVKLRAIEAKKARDAARVFCPCSREIYLNKNERTRCSACDLGMPPPAPAKPGHWKNLEAMLNDPDWTVR